jgi:hypothetical protein
MSSANAAGNKGKTAGVAKKYSESYHLGFI